MDKRDMVDVCLVLGFCFLFLIVTFCDILRRCMSLLNPFLKHLFSRGNHSSSTSNQDQSSLLVLDESFPDDTSLQSGGLDFFVISSLRVSQFDMNDEGERKPVNADCVICLGEFEEGEKLKLLPKCTHGFHVSCIDAWFQSHSNCPLCRSRVHHVEDADSVSPVSSHALLGPLRREDFSRESDSHIQSIRSEIIQNLANTHTH